MTQIPPFKYLFVSNAEFTKRYAICAKCEYFKKVLGKCRKCGCLIRAKASLTAAECPEDKWNYK